jgi:hypothetical protein
MNLFRSRNKFEKKLQQKMQLHEVTPGDSLWDRIAHELPKNSMEQQLRSKLNTFEREPERDAWSELEQLLHKEEQTNRWWMYAPLLLLLAISAVAFVFTSIQMYDGAAKRISKVDQIKKTELAETPGANSDTEQPNKENIIARSNRKMGVEPTIAKTEKYLSPVKAQDKIVVPPKIATANKSSNIKARPIASNSAIAENKSSMQQNIENNVGTVPINESDYIHTTQNPNKSTNKEQHQEQANTKADDNAPLATIEPRDKQNDMGETATDSLHQSGLTNETGIGNSNKTTKNLINNDEEDGPSPFSIGVLAGANYCMMQLQSPQSNRYPLVENTQLRKSIERPQIDLAVQFLLQYHLNQNWAISSGVGRLLFRQTFFYNIMSPSVAKDDESLPQNAKYANDSIVTGNNFQSEIRYSWTELPLNLHYHKQLSRKIQLHVQSGITYAILANVDVSMVNYDNIGVLQFSSKNEFPGFRNSLFVQGGAGIMWRINETVQINVQPHFRIGMNNMVGNINWVEQRPLFFGLQLGIFKRL